LNASTHDPAPLGDLPVTFKPEPREQVLWSGVKVGAALRLTSLDLFRGAVRLLRNRAARDATRLTELPILAQMCARAEWQVPRLGR
jgi:hypothetical protein